MDKGVRGAGTGIEKADETSPQFETQPTDNTTLQQPTPGSVTDMMDKIIESSEGNKTRPKKSRRSYVKKFIIIISVVVLGATTILLFLARQSSPGKGTEKSPTPISTPALDPEQARIAQISKDAQAIVNGGDTDNINQLAQDIFSVEMPMYDDANMMFALAKYYTIHEDKPAAQYFLARIDYVVDHDIDKAIIQTLANQIETLPDPVIEDGINI